MLLCTLAFLELLLLLCPLFNCSLVRLSNVAYARAFNLLPPPSVPPSLQTGPKIKPIRTWEAVKQMHLMDCMETCPFVHQTLSDLRKEVGNEATVLGFVGLPYTLATYLVEGSSSKEYLEIKKMMFQEPALLQQMLSVLADNIGEWGGREGGREGGKGGGRGGGRSAWGGRRACLSYFFCLQSWVASSPLHQHNSLIFPLSLPPSLPLSLPPSLPLSLPLQENTPAFKSTAVPRSSKSSTHGPVTSLPSTTTSSPPPTNAK